MKKKLLALSLATFLLIAAATPAVSAEINPIFPALFTGAGLPLEETAPISRAAFSMLAFETFRSINNDVLPQMEAKNIFSDVGDAPEDMFVVMLYGMGIVNGVGGNAFAPRRAITRQEACTIIARVLLRQNSELYTEIETVLQGDVDAADINEVAPWAKESVSYMYKKGILSLKDGRLAPSSELSNEEAMLLCSACIQLSK